MTDLLRNDPELWGGLECTVNRVGDQFMDQTVLTGHQDRQTDLDLVAALGVRAVRYPVLWERVAPDRPDQRDWQWTDARLMHLRGLGIRVIAGLVHHGSGPRYTDLLSDGFAPGLADHAAAVAERYPWIEDWTPVNEPVTTARFACLYGHWYPHHRRETSFWLALLNQVDATRLAMRAVRRVNPAARLIQTDDLGRTFATSAVREQAAFDNVRRWMGWDLLTGRVVPGHDFWHRLCAMGFESRLRAIADDPCPPDIVGINHYLTSDRFLDHRVQRYDPHDVGGSGVARFADATAIRVLNPPPPGLAGVLREAWDRYQLPLAVTEAHNGCTREEQVRWMQAAWDDAARLRREGIDVRAVTSWALMGSCNWDQLLTGPGRYEAGAFDVRSGTPRATAVAALLRRLADEPARLPPVAGPGWWQRPMRLLHRPVARPAPVRAHLVAASWRGRRPAPPLLITGATGTLGQAMARACRQRGIAHVLAGRSTIDLFQPAAMGAALDSIRPWAVVNTAGWVRVDDAEGDEDACFAANATGAVALADAAARRGIPTVQFSSDLVFDGTASAPYVEHDRPRPINAYGRSKLAVERGIAALPGSHLMVRTAAFFSAHDPHNFAWAVTRTLGDGGVFTASDDHVVSPTFVPDLVDAVLDLLIDGATGVWHLTNGEGVSWAEFARRIAQAAGQDAGSVAAVDPATLGWRAPRPPQVALASERGQMLPPLADAIARFARDLSRHPLPLVPA